MPKASAAAGSCARNTARQPKLPVSHPPATGPSAAARVKQPAIQAWKRPRSRGGTASPMIAMVRVLRPPPAAPCSSLPASSQPKEPAVAATALPAACRPSETSSSRRRPSASPSWPQTGAATVAAMR